MKYIVKVGFKHVKGMEQVRNKDFEFDTMDQADSFMYAIHEMYERVRSKQLQIEETEPDNVIKIKE